MAIQPKDIPGTLKALCKRAGLSQQKFAVAMDYENASGVQRYFTEERKTYLRLEWVIQAAGVLQGKGNPPIHRQEVLEMAGPLPENAALPPSSFGGSDGPAVDGKLTIFGAKDLPILGHIASAGGGYVFEPISEARAYTGRPGDLVNVRDAYGFRIQDDLMEPVFKLGSMAYVDPTQPALPGDDVIVILKDGTGYLGVFVRRNAKHLVCGRYKDDQQRTFPTEQLRDVHVVIMVSRRRV